MIKKVCLAGLVVLLLVSGGFIFRLKAEVADSQTRVAEIAEQITVFNIEKSNLQEERTKLRAEVIEKETKIVGLGERLDGTIGQLAMVRKTSYDDGYKKGKESVLPRKPTYLEVQDLLAKDSRTVWALSPNICTILAMESREYWREKGLKVGVVAIFVWGIGGHLAIVFDTSDRGEIYVDLMPNEKGNSLVFKEIKVEVGKSYTQQNGLPSPGFDDTIYELKIMW